MPKQMIKCFFCDFAFKDEGKWKDYYQMRRHLEEQHPKEAKELREEITKINISLSELHLKYGWAAPNNSYIK